MAADLILVAAPPEEADFLGDELRFTRTNILATRPRLYVGEISNRAILGDGGALATWLHPTVAVVHAILHAQSPRELTPSLAFALSSAFRLTSEHGVYNGGPGVHTANEFLARHAGWWVGLLLE
jgi:hypothetical protein